MATKTGTSNGGYQESQISQQVPATQLSLKFPAHPLPPDDRVGYFYVYLYLSTAPFQCYLVYRGAIYQPGVYILIPQLQATGNWFYRVDFHWDVPNLGWSLTVA
jgi:hypothetical protein